LVEDLVDEFDFSVNEQCHEYDECEAFAPFIEAGKPVFNAEYASPDNEASATTRAETICPDALGADFRTLLLPLDLDDRYRVSCDE
jgi:hypothetical protein